MKKIFYPLLIIMLLVSCSIEVEESDDYGTGEGSPNSPVLLTLGTAHSCKVSKWDYSFYSFTTSSTGAGTYELAFTSLTISDSWSSSKSIGIEAYTIQDSPNTSSVDTMESLIADGTAYFGYKNVNASTTYYIRVYGYGKGTYTLTMTKGGSEGSEDNPVELTLGTAHAGTVEGYESYYLHGSSF